MKIAAFNVNNINKRLNNLMVWLAKAKPDVVSLQELKTKQRAFPPDALRTVGSERSRPSLESLKQWLEEILGRLSKKSDTSMAVRYALGRWEALLRYR